MVHDGTVWVASSDSDDPRWCRTPSPTLSGASPTDDRPAERASDARGGRAPSATCQRRHDVRRHLREEAVRARCTPTPGTRRRRRGATSKDPFEIPEKTQGIAVRGNEIVFSTSLRPRQRQPARRATTSATSPAAAACPTRSAAVDLPNMSEGLVMLPDGIVTTHESGASPYSTPDGKRPDDLWAGTFMTVTPVRRARPVRPGAGRARDPAGRQQLVRRRRAAGSTRRSGGSPGSTCRRPASAPCPARPALVIDRRHRTSTPPRPGSGSRGSPPTPPRPG